MFEYSKYLNQENTRVIMKGHLIYFFLIMMNEDKLHLTDMSAFKSTFTLTFRVR